MPFLLYLQKFKDVDSHEQSMRLFATGKSSEDNLDYKDSLMERNVICLMSSSL